MMKVINIISIAFLLLVKRFSVRLYMRLFTSLLRRRGVLIIGTPRFISPWTRFDIHSKISLGERVVISDGVIFLNHDYSLTTALRAAGNAPASDMAFAGSISIGDNVFIGMNSLILPGTSIGSNTIIGAGAVVKGFIGSGVVVIGNPGKVIGSTVEFGRKWSDAVSSREVIVDRN